MSKQIITIPAPDQVHAFLDLWAMRVNLSPYLSLVDICQSADGKTHTFALTDIPNPTPAYQELPLTICPDCSDAFVEIGEKFCPSCLVNRAQMRESRAQVREDKHV